MGPPVEAAQSEEAQHFMRVMARLHADPDGTFASVMDPTWFAPLLERFGAALARCLPHLDPQTLAWRMHLMTGSMAHVILRGPTLQRFPVCPSTELDLERLGPQLVDFLCGALTAPAGSPVPDAGG